MNNKKYYPFKRNNYFYGKLLTVRDFEEEQKYINDKRRINNVLTNGVGVVGGLSVLLINEKTISIESGMALDYAGREILIEEATAKKLNVIEGYEEISDQQDVYLCIEYAENFKEPVYSVTGKLDSDGRTEYNRVHEEYKLYLTNRPLMKQSAGKLLAENHLVIYNKYGVKVTQTIPRFINPGNSIDIKVKVERTTYIKGLEVDFYIQAAHFKSSEGGDFVHVYYKDDEAIDYKTSEVTYVMTANTVFDTDAELKVQKGSIRAGAIKEDIIETEQRIIITKQNIYDAIVNRYLALNFDDILNMVEEIPIYLAKFRLTKKESDYIIKDFEGMPFHQYIISNEMLYTYIRSIRNEKAVEQSKSYIPAKIEKIDSGFVISNGQENIEIDLKSKGKTYFSGEIAHGLGTGNAVIQIGIEDLKNDKTFGDTKKILFGDVSVLSDTSYEAEIPLYSTAIIAYPEKGTFRVAIKFAGNIDRNEISVQWFAYKSSAVKDINYAEATSVSIKINEKLVTLAPRERFKFTVSIEGTDNKECRWSVVDKGGGEIDLNGIYEAPEQIGVYEIMAQSVKYPHKTSKTFIVVQHSFR